MSVQGEMHTHSLMGLKAVINNCNYVVEKGD